MQASPAKPVTVTLGAMTERAAARVRSGDYATMSEVLRAGLRALDREDAAHDARLKVMIEQAMADPRPPIPLPEAVVELKRRAAAHRAQHGD